MIYKGLLGMERTRSKMGFNRNFSVKHIKLKVWPWTGFWFVSIRKDGL